MSDERLEARLEAELPDDLKGSFDAEGKTIIPGYTAPAVDPEDASDDLAAEEAEVVADAASDEVLMAEPASADGSQP